MRYQVARVLLATIAILFLALPAVAQELICVSPAEMRDAACLAKIPKDSSGFSIVLRLVGADGVSQIPVTFTRQPGAAGSIAPSSTTGTTGLVETRWTGSPGSGISHFVATATMRDGRQVFRDVKIEAAVPVAILSLNWQSGDYQTWYEKRQLPFPLVIEVHGADSKCTGAVVFFRPSSGGTASPDSVYATRPAGSDSGPCVAQSYWRLGEGVGFQHMTAVLRGEPSRNETARARVRLLPRIGAGIVATHDYRAHHTVKDSSRVIRVTRKIVTDSPAGDSTVSLDSVVPLRVIRQGEEGLFAAPVVNFDFPLRARWTHARLSLGVSLKDPTRDWYLGFSPLQAWRGLAHENLGVDVHLVMHVGRRRVLDDSACRTDRDFSDCVETDRVFFPMGFGASVQFDGTNLLATLGSLFK